MFFYLYIYIYQDFLRDAIIICVHIYIHNMYTLVTVVEVGFSC